MTPHTFTIEEYERIGELGLVCHRVELINGVIMCRDTGMPYRFQPSDFEKLVEAGLIDPDIVCLIAGELCLYGTTSTTVPPG